MHKDQDDGALFLWNPLPFCFVLPGSKSSLVYIIFQTPIQSLWSHLLCTCCIWTYLLSIMLPMQLTWHFCWGNSCIMFTLRKKCVYCYATQTTLEAILYETGADPIMPSMQLRWHVKGILRITQNSSITRASPSDCLVSYPGHLLSWEALQRCCWCILQLQLTWLG